jgi:hypothetical protein
MKTSFTVSALDLWRKAVSDEPNKSRSRLPGQNTRVRLRFSLARHALWQWDTFTGAARRAYQTGLDISDQFIEEARARSSAIAAQIEWVLGDICGTSKGKQGLKGLSMSGMALAILSILIWKPP